MVILLLTVLYAMSSSMNSMCFKVLETRHGLPENRIRGIIELSDGRIVVLSAGYLSVYNGNSFTSVHISDLPFVTLDDYNSNRHVFRDVEDRIWMKNGHEMIAFDTSSLAGISIDSLFRNIGIKNKVTNFFADKEGNYYLVCDKHDLFIWNKDQGLKLIDDISDTPYNKLDRIERIGKDLYLCFNSGSIVGINSENGKRIYEGRVPSDFSQRSFKKSINTILSDNNLIIAINLSGSNESYIFSFNTIDKSWQSPIHLNYLKTSLVELENGEILVGGKFLTKISPKFQVMDVFSHFKDSINYIDFQKSEISSIIKDSYGGLWFGTLDNGLVYLNSANDRLFLESVKEFPSEPSKRFCSDRAKNQAERVAPRKTNSTMEDSGNRLYIATVEGLIVLNQNDNLLLKIDRTTGINPDDIQAITCDKNKDVWFTTTKGINRLRFLNTDSIELTPFGELDGISMDGKEFRTGELLCDSSGVIYAGLTGGTIVFNPQEIKDKRKYSIQLPINGNRKSYDNITSVWWWIIIAVSISVLTAVLTYNKKRNIFCSGSLSENPDNIDAISEIKSNKDLAMNISSNSSTVKVDNNHENEDTLLLLKLRSLVEKHISDPTLSVQVLSEMMSMERSVLYRKMQALTGLSPSEYLKEIKMKVAANTLTAQPSMSITEVAELTGFSDTKYFSKVFKAYYGISPRDYKKIAPISENDKQYPH